MCKMITYNDIYEASRKERYSDELQELSKEFISDAAEYFREKKEVSMKEDGDFSDVVERTKKQLENAQTIFRELILRRRKKILNLVLIASETGISKKDYENMLDSEKEFFDDMMKCIDKTDKKLKSVLENNTGKNEPKNNLSIEREENEIKTANEFEDSEKQKILFKEYVGELMDLSGEKIGPFKEGEIVELSKEIAQILVEDGKAEKS